RRMDAWPAERCGERCAAWPACARLLAPRLPRGLAVAAYSLVWSHAAIAAHRADPARLAGRGAVCAPCRRRRIPRLADLRRAADRNGAVIARNYSGYTLEIFPRRVKNIERTIDAVSEFVDITPRDRARFRKLLQETRNAESLPVKNRLSDEEVAKFAANRYRFEGVEIKARLFRQYPYGDVGSHVLGYLG